MKGLFKSKLALCLVAVFTLASVIIPLSGHILPSRAASASSQASSGWQLQELWHTPVTPPEPNGAVVDYGGVSDMTYSSGIIYETFRYVTTYRTTPERRGLTSGFDPNTGASVWRQEAGLGWQAPLVSNGNIIVPNMNDFVFAYFLSAFDAANDQLPQVWCGQGIVAAINNGVVYAQAGALAQYSGGPGYFSYDAGTGQKIWQQTDNACGNNPNVEVYNNIVYYIGCANSSGYSIEARSTTDGSIVWSKNEDVLPNEYLGHSPTYNSTLISNGSIFYSSATTDGSNNPSIASYSTTDGIQNWHKTLSDTQIPAGTNAYVSQIIASGSAVYVLVNIVQASNPSLLSEEDVYALDAATGNETWHNSTIVNASVTDGSNAYNQTLAHGTLVNGVLYFNYKSAIYAWDASTGNQLMMDDSVATSPNNLPVSTPLVVGNVMYITREDTSVSPSQYTLYAYKIIRSCQLNLTPPQPVGAPKLTQLSCDPYTNTDPTSQHQTEVEPDTFSFGSTIVSAFQVGRFSDGGSDNIGWATSTDGGVTWTHGFLPGTTQFATQPGIYERASDPSVAYDSKDGVWMISWLGINMGKGKAVLVSRSSDGVNWDILPVTVATGVSLDKNWTVCDNVSSSFSGYCYTEWDDLSGVQPDNTCPKDPCGLIQMSTSINGGKKWLPALSTAKSAHGLGGQPLVQPNGTVIVPYEGTCGFSLFDYCLSTHLLAFTSLNGGVSWNEPKQIASVQFHQPAGNLRAGSSPSAEIDKSGTVYVVWSDCRFEGLFCSANDIVMSTLTSVDPKTGATKWSLVKRITIDPKGSSVDHFIPGLAVDSATSGSTAHLALTYYYYPVANCNSTCELDVGYISSIDGGNHWSSFTQIAGPMKLSWLAQTDQGAMVGDYISASILGGIAYPVFAVANAPVETLLNEAMYTVGEKVVGPALLA